MAESFGMIVARTSTAIAAGTAQTISRRLPGGRGRFHVEDIRIVARISAAVASAVVGTPLPAEPDPKGANNDLPSLALVDVLPGVNNDPWTDGLPLPASLLGGIGKASAGIGTRPVIAGGQDFTCVVENRTNLAANSASLHVDIVLVGKYVS